MSKLYRQIVVGGCDDLGAGSVTMSYGYEPDEQATRDAALGAKVRAMKPGMELLCGAGRWACGLDGPWRDTPEEAIAAMLESEAHDG